MIHCGTKNASSMASLEEPLFLGVYMFYILDISVFTVKYNVFLI